MIARTIEEKEGIAESGRRLGVILEKVAAAVHPGVTSAQLNDIAEQLIREGGDEPAFLDYKPERASRPYPAVLCVSVNDEVVHGIPNEAPRTLQEGDIVALDLGLTHKGYTSDSAITVAVGKANPEAIRLMDVTRLALEAGIKAAVPGCKVGDISHAIEVAFEGSGISIVRSLGGHGVGAAVHEEPFVANVGHPGTGPQVEEGQVLALEPIANMGKAAVVLAPDGYTYRTKDGSLSAHFEHTIIVEQGGARVLTRRPGEVA